MDNSVTGAFVMECMVLNNCKSIIVLHAYFNSDTIMVISEVLFQNGAINMFLK